MTKSEDVTTFSQAFELLADGLNTHETIQTGSFWEFLRDIWSQGFDHPEYFKAWHVGVVAEDIERCLEEGLNYCAVLPRFHFKSTILGHAFSVWRLLQATRDMSVLYLSYSDGMAKYHISEINKEVNRNPILMSWLKNRSPKADYSFRYHLGTKPVEIMHGGLFSFKRGMHVNGALIADDVLRDPENPLNPAQINKVEDHFMTESLFIPLKDVPVIVLGTPMMPGDLLTKLQKDDRFMARNLPALDPAPNRRVLMPELYSEDWLLQQQAARPKSFASEFLLIPHFSTEAYFEEEDITKCEDETLVSHPASKKYERSIDEQLFAGFDVGKKRHPSHLVIFRRRGDKLEQIHQSWLDGWNYTDQVDFLNDIAENFDLMRGYIDNTRGELEDRGLANIWRPMTFSRKSKNTMAQILEQYIMNDRISFIKDERQKQQILSVNNDLKAPETPMGHGDAFFSIAMAAQAAYELEQNIYTTLGSATEWLDAVSPGEVPERKQEISIADTLYGKRDDKLNVQDIDEKGVPTLRWTSDDGQVINPPNPHCQEVVCTKEFWVPERNLCIYCGHRG